MSQQLDQHVVGQQLRVEDPVRRIIASKAALHVLASSGKLPSKEAGQPADVAAHHLRGNVAAVLAQAYHLLGKLPRPLQISSSPVKVNWPHSGNMRSRGRFTVAASSLARAYASPISGKPQPRLAISA